MKQTFEDFLENIANENLDGVLDDDAPDAVSDWIGNLDVQEVIEMAETFGAERFLEGQKLGIKMGNEITLSALNKE